jgi:ubiquinone/menaquinone biosynthesis C-methylase UbiE
MTLAIDAARKFEHLKYERAYTNKRYRMKNERRMDAVNDIKRLPVRGSYLDVGCGQGDMLDWAERLDFRPVHGTEIVASLIDRKRVSYAEVHALPFIDSAFNVVTMFDVIEHLIPGDDERACLELQRVAKHHVVLTANNGPSFNKFGDDLHINKRPYDEWDSLFRKWFNQGKVTWIKGDRNYISEAWRIDLQK